MTDEQEAARTNKHIGSSFGDFDAEQAAISQVCKWLLEQGYATGHGDNLDDVLTHLVEQVAEIAQPKQCRWVNDDPDGWNAWETECEATFELNDGTPQDNGMKYCPYCGGELVTDESD